MKKSWFFSGLFAFLGIFLAAVILLVCLQFRDLEPIELMHSQGPENCANEMLTKAASGDFTGAFRLFYGNQTASNQAESEEYGQILWSEFVSSLQYELVGSSYATADGIAQDVRIRSMNIPALVESMRNRTEALLNERISAASSSSEILINDQEYRPEFTEAILRDAASQAAALDGRPEEKLVTMHFVHKNGQWLVLPEQAVLNAISGGILNSGSTTAVPNIYAKYADLLPAEEALIPQPGSEGFTAVLPVERRKLDDHELIAPKPDPNAYGVANTAQEISWLPAKAASLLEGQELYFGEDRVLMPGSKIRYYLDDSIAVITWKELLGNAVLTFAEVKIADGSQFRRFLAGGQFGAETQFYTTDMAQSVNAVVASSGDFYKMHYNGVVVYDSVVRRVHSNKADTCYIDDKGDLHFTYQDQYLSQEEAQRYVNENNIRFSLIFGPVLVDDGVPHEWGSYDLGQVESFSPRAALCQMDSLHYLLVTSGVEEGYSQRLTMRQFADRIIRTGCNKAYALDGGQTAAITLDGKLVNEVLFGQQRTISDIIYFATAIPDGGY